MTPPVPWSWVTRLRVNMVCVGCRACFGRVSSVMEAEDALGLPGGLLSVQSRGSLGSCVRGGSGFLRAFFIRGS